MAEFLVVVGLVGVFLISSVVAAALIASTYLKRQS